jgi:Holliday junction resolvase RusA-like endonuclease
MGTMRKIEMNAPQVKAENVRINFIVRGEPLAWKRATFAKYGRFRQVDDPENVKAKDELREKFEWAYPNFKPIEKRRLGVQLFFQTSYDSKDKDNMEKLVNDAFNGVIWADDRQIKEGYQRVNVTDRDPAFTQIVVYLLDWGA